MINNEKAPTGRPAGAHGWAGLANLFYWIDRENGFGGYWATQILAVRRSDLLHQVHGAGDRLLQRPRLTLLLDHR